MTTTSWQPGISELMSIWRIEFHNYLIDAFLEPNTLFGNFIYYTIIGLLLAFSFGNDTDNSKEVEDYFKLFKYVSFAQTAFGLVNNSSKLNDPRKYLQKMSSSKRGLNISDICRNIFLITITSGMFRIFISFWYSVMVYPIVKAIFCVFFLKICPIIVWIERRRE